MIRLLILFLILFPKINSLAQSITAGTVSANDTFFPLAVDYTVKSTFNQSSTTIPGTTYSVDVNNDGELDFAITGYQTHMGMGGYFSGFYITPLSGTLTSKAVAASINSCTLMNGTNVQTVTANMAKAFNTNDIIDASANWDNSSAYLYTFERWGFNGCGCRIFIPLQLT